MTSTAPSDREAGAAPYDPLRLCIFATVALLGWLLGPVALLGFAVLGLVGYTKAYRAGLTRSMNVSGVRVRLRTAIPRGSFVSS